jgi:hypothetical protein
MVSSQFWQPYINAWMLGQSTAGLSKSGQEERLWSVEDPSVGVVLNHSEIDAALKNELLRLRRENRALRTVLSKSKMRVKHSGEDLKFLAVELLKTQWRQSGSVALLNAGRDYGLRQGDWLLHRGGICGKIEAVADKTSMAVDLCSVELRALVEVEGVPGEVIWEGLGGGKGVVRVRRGAVDTLVGKAVFLSEPISSEGSYPVGQVMAEMPDRRGGWMRLEVKGRKIPESDILFVMQRHETSTVDLFAQRDRLGELKKEVRQLELNKLRLELLQP